MEPASCVFKSHNLFEAHLVVSVLANNGLKAYVRGEHLVGLVGAIPVGDAMAQVWVGPGDTKRANEILGFAVTRDTQGRLSLVGAPQGGELSDPETCPSCGETWEPGFEVCWSCEAPLGGDT